MRKPFNGNISISQPFGAKSSLYASGVHYGTDYNCPIGTPIYACEAGTVTYINVNQADVGNAVQYQSNDGVRVWRSLHLNSYTVSKGQKINEGQLIGYSGNTGYSTGPHLHQDVKINGVYTDPEAIYNTNQGSSNVADIINLDTARIVAYGVGARNGMAGRSNALNGSSDADLSKNHIGKALTNKWVQDWFLSQEARQWRDTNDVNSVNEVNKRYNEYGGLVQSIKDKDTAIKTLNDQITKLNKENEKLKEQAGVVVEKPVYIEVEPSWLTSVRNAINKFLKRS